MALTNTQRQRRFREKKKAQTDGFAEAFGAKVMDGIEVKVTMNPALGVMDVELVISSASKALMEVYELAGGQDITAWLDAAVQRSLQDYQKAVAVDGYMKHISA